MLHFLTYLIIYVCLGSAAWMSNLQQEPQFYNPPMMQPNYTQPLFGVQQLGSHGFQFGGHPQMLGDNGIF